MQLLTVKQVAKQLDVNIETIYRWLRSGKLKGNKLGHELWRISDSDLNEFIEADHKE